MLADGGICRHDINNRCFVTCPVTKHKVLLVRASSGDAALWFRNPRLVPSNSVVKIFVEEGCFDYCLLFHLKKPRNYNLCDFITKIFQWPIGSQYRVNTCLASQMRLRWISTSFQHTSSCLTPIRLECPMHSLLFYFLICWSVCCGPQLCRPLVENITTFQ